MHFSWKQTDFLDSLMEEMKKARDTFETFVTDKFEPAEKEWRESEELRDVAAKIEELEHHKGWLLVKEQRVRINRAPGAFARVLEWFV